MTRCNQSKERSQLGQDVSSDQLAKQDVHSENSGNSHEAEEKTKAPDFAVVAQANGAIDAVTLQQGIDMITE